MPCLLTDFSEHDSTGDGEPDVTETSLQGTGVINSCKDADEEQRGDEEDRREEAPSPGVDFAIERSEDIEGAAIEEFVLSRGKS